MSIIIRHAGQDDAPTLKQMHAGQGFGYELPALFDGTPQWALRAVLEEEPGHPQLAILLRRTVEEYLLISPSAGKGGALIGKILALQKESSEAAHRLGYTDIHCWLPPQIQEKFGKHLAKLGWLSPEWKCFTRDI